MYYFKPTNIRFNVDNFYFDPYPVVKGDILDVNLKKVEDVYEDRISIKNLREIKDENNPERFRNRITNIKNTY